MLWGISLLPTRIQNNANYPVRRKVRFVEHPKLGVPFTGGNKDTPDIGSNDAKGSNKAENIEASSKGKGVAGEKSGSKEVTGDTTEQLKAAQVTANRPQIPRMYPYDPKDHGVATRLQYHPRAPAMNAYDPKDHGAATRLQYIMYGETKKL